MTELKDAKPCCHCGGTTLYIDYIDRNYGGHSPYRVACICGATGSYAPDEPSAVAKWNERPVEDALREQLAAALDGTIAALEKAKGLRDRAERAEALLQSTADSWTSDTAGYDILWSFSNIEVERTGDE